MTQVPSPSEQSRIVARYNRIYHLNPGVVGYSHVIRHWNLERRLTSELLSTTKQNRWDVFERCYTELYANLDWLNRSEDEAPAETLGQWKYLISSGSKVFEIGSGKAVLLKYLRANGCDCVATEITRERGSHHASAADDLEWQSTDGIHLAQSQQASRYDVVLSTGVVEHFHPDDIEDHFRNALAILKTGGRYILTTPHRSSGPHDLSAVFLNDEATCMHLREYTYGELGHILKAGGYRSIRAVFPPNRIYRVLPLTWESRFYFQYLRFWDWLERTSGIASRPQLRRSFRKLLKMALVPDNIWISAFK